jgi:hypothetical protein
MQDISIPDSEPAPADHEDDTTKEKPSTSEVDDVQNNTLVESKEDAEIPTSVEEQTEEQAPETDIVMEESSVEKNVVDPSSAADVDETPRYVSQGVQTDDVMVIEPTTEPSQTGSSILGSLRKVLSGIKNVTFGRNVLREIDDVMFDIRVEAHEAARRSQV